ncbi:hypothetical protein PROFUN_12219 [Planoprotostelium fungivorum]|uniref:Uncharacterized protein n=1 Tax=Planoprotostelium fungivorum TaxID=1890364 RepID=A0A2P6N852_9EUKA|nr:hypothetical protein PROFUN_12219 [Planoprotostelium fungivorum]
MRPPLESHKPEYSTYSAEYSARAPEMPTEAPRQKRSLVILLGESPSYTFDYAATTQLQGGFHEDAAPLTNANGDLH